MLGSSLTREQQICKPKIPDLRQKLQKPLRPIWITQASTLPTSPPTFPAFHPIILCTASRRVHGGEVSEAGYIQGAADDHEAWACGLTPQVFWKHHSKLLSTNEEDLPSLIAELAAQECGPAAVPICLKPASNLYISSSQIIDLEPFDAIISCTPDGLTTTEAEHLSEKKYLHLPLVPGKLGSRELRAQLSQLTRFIEGLQLQKGSTQSLLICDPTGKDLSVGVALAILCLYTDKNGRIQSTPIGTKIDKSFIKQRLTWITTASPVLNPSRATLQSVNAFLMPYRSSDRNTTVTQQTAQSKLILVNGDGTPVPVTEKPAPRHIPVTELPYDDISTLDGSPPAPPRILSDTPSFPETLFTNLQTPTPWTFSRTLTSKLPTHPSGQVKGTATFTPLNQNQEPSSEGCNPSLVYAEEGTFTTDTGASFVARRKYVYRIQDSTASGMENEKANDSEKATDKHIAVYFHSEGTAPHTDLFVEMGPLQPGSDKRTWSAENRAQHLCGEDLYTAHWRFYKGMLESDEGERGKKRQGEDEGLWWEVRYDVKGPRKDYVSETRYSWKRG
jgi:tRNA A64-2'-O-ribosylphosphate transferase